jgi:hypothetical protein
VTFDEDRRIADAIRHFDVAVARLRDALGATQEPPTMHIGDPRHDAVVRAFDGVADAGAAYAMALAAAGWMPPTQGKAPEARPH